MVEEATYVGHVAEIDIEPSNPEQLRKAIWQAHKSLVEQAQGLGWTLEDESTLVLETRICNGGIHVRATREFPQ